jgi:hypothetical protein
VLGLPVHHDGVAATSGQRLRNRDIRIKAVALLIERRDCKRRSETHRSGIRRKHAGEQADQRGLAAAVRPDDAEPVAALNAG